MKKYYNYSIGDKVIFTELDFSSKRKLYCRVLSINDEIIRIIQFNGRYIETNVHSKDLKKANLLEILCNELFARGDR